MLLGSSAPARAQGSAPQPDAAPAAEPALAPVAPAPPPWNTAPRPDEASGITRAEPTPLSHHLRWVPRVLLFVPRWAIWVAAQPIRLGVWAYQHYNVPERFEYALFNVDDTGIRPVARYGLYPIVTYESGFGINGGLRFLHKDLGGEGERLRLKANFGGRFRQAYGFSLGSGKRFGDRVKLDLGGLYERRPKERFFGIGNADEVDVAELPMQIDPMTSEAAVDTRFREHMWRVILTADVPLIDAFGLRMSTALTARRFGRAGDDDDVSIEQAYDVDRLVGFQEGVDNLYTELELYYDTRRPTSPYQSKVMDATGWLLSGHLGVTTGVAGDPSDFVRYGADLQRYFDLYKGSRVLALRLLVEAVGGSDGRTDGAISFIDLPRLGGAEVMRGYPSGRYRDRSVSVATAEYSWDLGNFLAAYTFVDVGRAWRSLRDVEIDDSLRMGFGGGIQFHTNAAFVMRGQVAVSRDGDCFLDLVLSPAFGRRERAGRF